MQCSLINLCLLILTISSIFWALPKKWTYPLIFGPTTSRHPGKDLTAYQAYWWEKMGCHFKKKWWPQIENGWIFLHPKNLRRWKRRRRMKSLLYHITHQALMDISCCLMLHGRGTSYLVFFLFLKLKHKHMLVCIHRETKKKVQMNSHKRPPSNNFNENRLLLECSISKQPKWFLENCLYRMQTHLEYLSSIIFWVS